MVKLLKGELSRVKKYILSCREYSKTYKSTFGLFFNSKGSLLLLYKLLHLDQFFLEQICSVEKRNICSSQHPVTQARLANFDCRHMQAHAGYEQTTYMFFYKHGHFQIQLRPCLFIYFSQTQLSYMLCTCLFFSFQIQLSHAQYMLIFVEKSSLAMLISNMFQNQNPYKSLKN